MKRIIAILLMLVLLGGCGGNVFNRRGSADRNRESRHEYHGGLFMTDYRIGDA